MRKTGIDDKMVFFVRRYPEPEIGSYFEYRLNKEICNPNERQKFYLKIGGVTFLPKKPVPGKKISTSVERVKDSKYFGGYLYYGETDRRIRCVLYAKRMGLPEMKLTSAPSCLHSVIPRYDGTREHIVVTGMKICEAHSSERRWSRYDVRTKEHHKGFFEMHSTDNLNQLAANLPIEHTVYTNRPYRTGFYVGANTSLLMVDVTRNHLHIDYSRDFVFTLFQEGAFIACNCPFTFCFYDEEEDYEYDYMRFNNEMRHKLSESPNLDLIPGDDTVNRDRIYFLKSTPNHTLWTLRVHRTWMRSNELEVMLCVPSGAQLEDIQLWEDGITEIIRRQSLKPWSKYIEPLNTWNPRLEELDLDKDEPYPQMNP